MNDIKKINLIHVVDRLDIGGLENGVVNICNLLDRDKFNPCVCCLNGYGQMKDRLNDDVKVFNLKLPPKKSLSKIKKIASFFREQHADIVHTHAWGAGSFGGILAAKVARVPIIINGEHGCFFVRWYQLVIQRILFYLCDYNLSVSESLKNKAANILGLPANKITVIKNGVDTDRFNGQYRKDKILQKLKTEGVSISAETFNIFIIGSLKFVKAPMTVMRSVKMIKDKHVAILDKLRFIFVGVGPDLQFLQDYVRQHNLNDVVYFLGSRSDIPELLSVAHLLVSTSIASAEGLSNVMLEAMSSGVPVIATKSVASGEVVQDGCNGFLIREGDMEDLSNHIIELVNSGDKLVRLGQNARKNIIQNFSIKKMVENYENLYLRALSQCNFQGIK